MAMTTAAAEVGHGHNATPEFLADRARFVRLETVRLTRIAGAGHYSSTFSAAELFARAVLRPSADRSGAPGLAGSRPLHPEQGPRRDRHLSGAGRSRLLRACPARRLHAPGQPVRRPPRHEEDQGRRLQLRLPRARSLDRAWHGACRPGAAARVPGLLHAWRRRTARGPDLGSGDGGEPLPAPGPGRHRRPQRTVHRRPHRRHHGDRADRRALPQLRLEGPADRRPRPRCDPGRARPISSRRASAPRR